MSVPSPSLLADHVLLPVLANAAVHGDDRLHVTSGSHERAAGTGGDIRSSRHVGGTGVTFTLMR